MLYLKLMSGQTIADSDACHNYTLVPLLDTDDLTFETQQVDNGPQCPCSTVVWARIRNHVSERMREIALTGNAYVMNENGKTIASHASY